MIYLPQNDFIFRMNDAKTSIGDGPKLDNSLLSFCAIQKSKFYRLSNRHLQK